MSVKAKARSQHSQSFETREKIRKANIGRTFSEETLLKMSLAKKGKPSPFKGKKTGIPSPKKGQKSPKTSGKNNPNWKGGITLTYRLLRKSHDYKLWRRGILKRDRFTCIWCGATENLHVDHIKSFALYPELRFTIDNGRVLCAPCHKTTDTYGVRSKNVDNRKQIPTDNSYL